MDAEFHVPTQSTSLGDYIASKAKAPACPVNIPEGEIDAEMLGKIARENTGVAFNTYIDLAQNAESEAVRKQAADAILDRAHGKPSGDTTQVNVQVNTVQSLSESDQEILALYRQKIVDECSKDAPK